MSNSLESTVCDYEALNAPKSNFDTFGAIKSSKKHFKAKSRRFFILEIFILARLGAFRALNIEERIVKFRALFLFTGFKRANFKF